MTGIRALVAWIVLLAGFVVALRIWTSGLEPNPQPGLAVFGWFVLGLLLLLLLVVPLLSDPTAGEGGVLRRLVDAWFVGLVFLAAALPLAVATMVMGGVPVDRVAVAWLVLAVLLAVCTVLWHAAVLAAPDQARALARYSVVLLLLVVGTVLACNHVLQRNEYDERAWWLLAANPYAILVDLVAEPIPVEGAYADRYEERWASPWNPLVPLRFSLNDVRLPLWEHTNDDCVSDSLDGRCLELSERPDPAWPYGLAADAAIAAGALALATRRPEASA